MSNRIILHIGTPKTGTTAIQRFLIENESLLQQNGYSYPRLPGKGSIPNNGYGFSDYVKNGIVDTSDPGWAKLWKIIKTELAKKNVILSWEVIFNYDIKSFFDAIKKQCDTIQVIVYLRRQDRYIESQWNQVVKQAHYPFEFEEYVASGVLPLNYKERLDTIAQIIGKENLIVRIYEKGQFEGERKDVISDFLHALNIKVDWNTCKVTPNDNPSLLGNYLEIKRRLNMDFCRYRWFYIIESMLSETIFHRADSLNIKSAQGMFTNEKRTAFLQQYEADNAAIAREYLERDDGILFYDHQQIALNELDASTLPNSIKKIYSGLYEHWKKCISAPSIDTTSLKHSIKSVEKAQTQMDSELDELQKVHTSREDFIEKCFKIAHKYNRFLAEIYEDKFEKDLEIPEYLHKRCRGKRVFLFGTGAYSQCFVEKTNIFPVTFLDNNAQKQQQFYGKDILSPEQIENWNNCFVIIAVKKPEVIAVMEQQLKGYGLKKEVDYLVAPEYFMDPY